MQAPINGQADASLPDGPVIARALQLQVAEVTQQLSTATQELAETTEKLTKEEQLRKQLENRLKPFVLRHKVLMQCWTAYRAACP